MKSIISALYICCIIALTLCNTIGCSTYHDLDPYDDHRTFEDLVQHFEDNFYPARFYTSPIPSQSHIVTHAHVINSGSLSFRVLQFDLHIPDEYKLYMSAKDSSIIMLDNDECDIIMNGAFGFISTDIKLLSLRHEFITVFASF